MTRPLPISVCIISGAEAHRINRALASVKGWTQETIVVLNADVRDGTEELARGHGAKIFREPWKGHIDQKNSAAAKAGGDWLLGLDADEEVSPELREEIQNLFTEPSRLENHAAFSFPRLTCFCGRWIRHGDWYPDRGVRLWRKNSGEWGGTNPHDKLHVRGSVGRLGSNLLHYNAVGIDDQIAKISAYSEDFLRAAQREGRRVTWFDLACRPGWRFVRSYFFRLGFLDGWQGYYLAWITAAYTITRYAKVRATQGAPKNVPPP